MSVITVMVVDDSTVMRAILKRIIDADPDLTVIGEAVNGRDALAKVGELDPDVVVLDIEMPELDGMICLKCLRLIHRAAVVVVSSLVQAGSSQAMEALRRGAKEVVAKPSGSVSFDMAQTTGDLLVQAVRRAAGL
jgi:two-component system chemotaxis response regulator CheB